MQGKGKGLRRLVAVGAVAALAGLGGCAEMDALGRFDVSIHAVTPAAAAQWAEANNGNLNARLYVVRSSDLRGALEVMQAFGVKIPGVKDGGLEASHE